MAIKSINLLPEIFRSESNRKFLSATLDQLISESNRTQALNSYIGRKNAPTYKVGDTYIAEPDTARQNYQLESSLVVDAGQGETDFYAGYIDLLQQIEFYGGITSDHSRLFSNQSYSFDGCFDIDKFVNFTQYLWLPNGPPEVTVTASNLDISLEYNVIRSTAVQGYQFTEFDDDKNPIVTLVKGQTYRFRVNQPGFPFWIQTQPGATGTRSTAAEILNRTILGLDNNGIDSGTIEFAVPVSSAQDKVVTASLAAVVDYATDKSYREIQSQMTNQLAQAGGIDGVTQGLAGKTVIFVNEDRDNDSWEDPGNFDLGTENNRPGSFDFDSEGFEYGNVVPGNQRRGVFRIRLVDAGGGRQVIKLDPIQDVSIGQKIYVRAGDTNANVEYLLAPNGVYEPVPPVTAPLDVLYYQDGRSPGFFGTIRLVDPGVETIDVEQDILGSINYTSPNGVRFTNGLHVRFDSTARPQRYANNNYVVEGVGREIKLINVGNFSAPEQYAVDTDLDTPDYITINRASRDLNAWSRSNRWFHIQTVEAAAAYREDPGLLDLTGVERGKRPIIEFDPDLYLYNHGRSAKSPVDILDFTITDAFKEVEGKSSYVVRMPNGVTRELTPGTRIIFAADLDPEVRNRIYRVEEITTGVGTRLHLVSQATEDLPTYTVSGARITSNLAYDFVPTVSFSKPLPGIGTRTATGRVILNDTGIGNIEVDYGGVNFVADPYVQINSDFDTQANVNIVYAPFKKLDYIRIDTRGTAYTDTSPNVAISNPNEYFAKVSDATVGTSGRTFQFTGITASQWLGIQPGAQVIANGIIGGTLVTAVDQGANLVTINAPAISANVLATPPITGLTTVAENDVWIFKSNVDPGTFATVANTIKNSTLVTVDSTAMIDNGMIVSGGLPPVSITNIRIDVVPTRVFTSGAHNLDNGDVVLIRDVLGTTEFNFARYFVRVISDNVVDLYTSDTLSTTSAQDSRNFTNYISGGTLTAYTIDYASVKVRKVLSSTTFTVTQPITVRAGTRLVFGGVTAAALARSDGNGIYSIAITEPGSGYETVPSVTIDPSGGNPATATAIVNDDIINYIEVVDSGTGYRISDEVDITVVSELELVTNATSSYGSTTLYFDSTVDLTPVQNDWLVFLVSEINGQEIYTDFAQIPYAETEFSGPSSIDYRFFMDVTKTRASVRRVIEVDTDRIVLDGPINSLDSDGEIIDLPAGSKIVVTAQNRFFTLEGEGSSQRVAGGVKAGYFSTAEVVESNVLPLSDVNGIQPGMDLTDLAGALPSGIRVISVDSYIRRVTLNQPINLPANTPIQVSSQPIARVILQPATIANVDITDEGAGYTSAPVMSIQPLFEPVTLLAACSGQSTLGTYIDSVTRLPVLFARDRVLTVNTYNGIVLGSKVVSNYNNDGVGITTGSNVPTVVALVLEQTGSNIFEPRVVLDQAQQAFADLTVTFSLAAQGLALVEITNAAIDYDDETPETYDAEDSVLVNIPANESQTSTNVIAYNQYYYTGARWIAAQQKDRANQEPLYDAFDLSGTSASDSDKYPGSKFVGTRIFGYRIGNGRSDPVLGFPLSYRNFENVGDIEFTNYFQTDSFAYLDGFSETTIPISNFVLKEKTPEGFRIRNIWTPVEEKSKQFQVITKEFTGETNYFEIDIEPEQSNTIPYFKVYVGNQVLPSSAYTVTTYGGRRAVVIAQDRLDVNRPVSIKIYSKQISRIGSYETPINLDHNPLNSNFDFLTLGQVRNHLISKSDNHFGIVGDVLGKNNLRDLGNKNWQGSILQHASPVSLAGLFLVDKELNIIQSIELAQREYIKFKNRFLDMSAKMQIDVKNIPASVDAVLSAIMVGKSSLSPWYDSDMVPYGTKFRTVTNIPVLNIRQKTYLIPQTFDPTQLGRRAVLIYLKDSAARTNQHLLKDIDFTFDTATSNIVLKDHIQLNYNMIISVVDYSLTTENYVPETPTKLGLYPKYTPMIMTDDTYRTPVQVIQGHDGSLTPAFGDYRDEMLLELEKRIYNNIKVNFDSTLLELYDTVPGRYRSNDYSRAEFNQLLTRTFLGWVGNNRVNYTTNQFFSSSDSWTWNYNKFTDAAGERLPGYWRGIYQYFYDTDRPHVCPWEMLGFSEKPDWWESYYGAAPYTGGNLVMWEHLEAGYIADGDRQGTDIRFARPGLLRILPVDSNGQLVPPIQLMVNNYNAVDTAGPFAIGDQGPVETAWRRSSDYPFAVQIAFVLARPAFYLGTLFDNSRYQFDKDLGQIVDNSTRQRILLDLINVPDAGLRGSDTVLTAGYANWIRDYLVQQGIDGSSRMREYFKKLDVRLSYKVAGFTDKNMLEVVAEQSSPGGSGRNIVIPNENYRVYLNKSTPRRRLVYSAVIVERSNNGWKVSGYDTQRPFFTIIPSEVTGKAYTITELGISVRVYQDFQLSRAIIPYGTEFTTYQAVADFLTSYGRHLKASGFVFNEYNDILGVTKDFDLSIREFITWNKQGWKSGSILVLSPAGGNITVVSDFGVVDQITNKNTGNRLLDQNFSLIRQGDYTVTRDGGVFTANTLFDKMIALADLSLVDYEHVLIFDNTTVFNDTVYAPEIGNRQYRLRLIGYKTGDWNGQLYAPGYIYNNENVDEWRPGAGYLNGSLVTYKDQYYIALSRVPETTEFDFSFWKPIDKNSIKTGLLSNFANNANKFRYFYDVDQLNRDENLDSYSNGLIGFRNREYLQDLGIDPTTQVKFYQGYIKQKGTKNAITSLTSGQFDRVSSEITLYEEWALRVGEYGATGSDQYLEIELDDQSFTEDPSTVYLLERDQQPLSGVNNFNNFSIYRTSEEIYTPNIIKPRTDLVPRIGDNVTAGYPRLDDIDGTIYDINDYQNYFDLVSDLGAGYKVWVAVDQNKSWNVYRATETNVLLLSISRTNNNQLLFTFDRPHGSSARELIAIKNFGDNEFDGFYRVSSVQDNLSLLVTGYRSLDSFAQLQTIEGSGVYFRMISVRYDTVSEIIDFTPPHGWRDQDRVWIDNDTGTNIWGVFQKTDGWDFNQLLPLRQGEDRFEEGYGKEVKLSVDNQIQLAGTPNFTNGSLSGLKVIDPGANYVSPVVRISAPEGLNGVLAQFNALKDNGRLTKANVITSGTGYTIAPNVTISDEHNTVTTAQTLNEEFLYLSPADASRVYIGDFVYGPGIPDGWQVVEAFDVAFDRIKIDGPNYAGLTSATNIPMGTGEITFVTGLSAEFTPLVANAGIRAYPTGDTSRYLEGYVVSYVGNNLVANIEVVQGSGTFTSWVITTQLSVRSGVPIRFSRGEAGRVVSRLVPTSIDYIEVVDGGGNFVLTPQVEIVGGGGSGARASAVISGGVIERITLLDPGSGYTEAPDVFLITNNSTPVIIRARLKASAVGSLVVSDKGQNYRDPVITIQAHSGDVGINANATLSFFGNGGISSVTITNRGNSYYPGTTITLANSITGLSSNVTGAGFAGTVNVYANGVIGNVTITNSGSGYTPNETVANIFYAGGTGASGNVGRTIDGIADFTGATILSLGQGYLSPPTVEIIDQAGGGSGAVVEAIIPIGQVKTFLRPDQGSFTLEETQLIKTFNSDARAFGYSLDIGTTLAAIGAPDTYNEEGGVHITQTLGSQWISYQQLFPVGLSAGDRFGHSIAMSSDQQWIYIGAPGANKVYCYGKKTQSFPRVTIRPSGGQISYPTNLIGLKTANELKVLGSNGKLYEPGFDYDVASDGSIFFADYERIETQPAIFITRQRLQTTIVPTVIRNVVTRTYTLESRPETIDQLLVYGATGRVFVPNKEFTIIGSQIIFLNDEFLTEPTIVVVQKDVFYTLVEILTPPDTINQDGNFGWSVRCDNLGYRILVGAPDVDDTDDNGDLVPSAGRAYVFSRSYEVILSLGNSNIFTLDALRSVVSVSIDSVMLTNLIDYTVEGNSIKLTNVPRNGARVSIDTNFFNLVQILPCPSKINLGRFGLSVDISPDNRSLIVGSPGYRDDVYYNGEVYRYVNKGVFYGSVVTEKSFDQVSVLQGQTIKINDKTVTFSNIAPGVEINQTAAFSTISTEISLLSNVGIAIGDTVIGPDIGIGDGILVTGWQSAVPGLYSNIVVNAPVTVSSGDSLTFVRNGDNLSRIKNNIDAAGAVAVVTELTDTGTLRIRVETDKDLSSLDILPGTTGSALDGIGLKIYALTQTLQHPRYGVPEKFGTKVAIDTSGETVAIASEGGNTLKSSTFDKELTLFDKDTTRFIDNLNASGAVYIYDYLSPPGETFESGGRLLYNQVLQNAFILTGDNFGSSIDINRGWALVGAEFSNYHSPRAGAVHLFINEGDVKGWSRLRSREQEIDIDYINKALLYDKTKQISVTDLDYFDPAKGKILGIADQDLDYKSSYDPAYYNKGTRNTVTIDTDAYWGERQVTQTWWDLSLCRYINYEQGTISYRSTNWGQLFPDSEIQVCEWVESNFLPSDYADNEGDGEAKYPDNSAYVEQQYFDETTGLIKTKYYYWVIGKQLFDRTKTKRSNSVVSLQNIIRDPQAQGITYLAAVASNAFNIYNFKQFLKGDETILRIEYNKVRSDIISHNEFELVQEGNPNSRVPIKLINKLIDSLSGENSTGGVVPDLKLRLADAYGINNLPRQSMIIDNLNAAKVFVTFVNEVLKNELITRRRNLSRLLLSEPVPPSGVGFYDDIVDTVDQLQFIPESELFDGYKVLVRQDADFFGYWTIYEYNENTQFRMIRIQSYDTTRWWSYQDWYADGIDKFIDIDYTVARYTDIVRLSLALGDTVKVLNSGNGLYTVYQLQSIGLVEIIVENGTIELSNGLWDPALSRIGFDNSAFDQVGFSTTQSVELRNIFESLVYDIFIDENAVEINRLFFTLLNYILSEQTAVDWAIKTSLVTISHKIRKLEQFTNYIIDNQDYYEQYINEVKPYRTQIREYLLAYQGTDVLDAGISDFDFPSIYDTATQDYKILDPNNARDLILINNSSRRDWLLNYKYQIQSVVLNSGGQGYTATPRVQITGGGGSGATARAVLGVFGLDGTASVVEVILLTPGSGYTSTPTVEFLGGNGLGASAAIVLVQRPGTEIVATTLNKKIRSVFTKIKFDRVSYTSSLRSWKPYEIYQPGDIIVVDDTRLQDFANYVERQLPRFSFVYRVLKTLTGRATIDLNVFEDPTIVQKLSGNDLDNANDRLAAYLKPGSPDIARIFSSPDVIRLDNSEINDQVISVAKQWNAVRHSGFYPVQHGFQYAAVGDASLIGLSRDGKIWSTNRITDTSINVRDVFLYNNFTWVAVGNQGTIYTNDDGENWIEEKIDQYRYDASSDNINGRLQENTAQTLDMTGGVGIRSSYSDYIVVAGNNNLILANPRGNSALSALPFDGWYNIKTTNRSTEQNYLRLLSVNRGDLADVDGSTYLVEIQPVSGYFVESNTTNARTMKAGFLATMGVNGSINVITFNALDDYMQGFLSGYNYNQGKNGNLNYPWIPLQVPVQVRGQNDSFSGEQITAMAVSGSDTNWMVAVGSGGTLLWNQFSLPIEIQDGRAEVAPDTIGKTVVDYKFRAFDNFRYFDEDNFLAPLSRDLLNSYDFKDVTWDGEKFIVVGSKSIILWGTPAANQAAYVDIGTLSPIAAVSSRRETASWSAGTLVSSVEINVPISDIDGLALENGMIVYASGIPADATISSVAIGGANVTIQVAFTTSNVTAGSQRSVSFAYGLTANVAANSIVTFTDGATTITGTVSALAQKASTRIYLNDYDERVQANWTVSGTGIPAGARVRNVGKFAEFRWQFAPGVQENVNLDYRTVSVNTRTVTINRPLLAANAQAGIQGIKAGNVITFFDPTGTIIQLASTQDLPANSTVLTFETVEEIQEGYRVQASTLYGIPEDTVVTSQVLYNIAGVVSKLAKDIPDLVPGTQYPGSRVQGTEFSNTLEDNLGLDTNITSEFTDNLLGTRPEDITIDGGKFIDTFNSHAPEELVPGQVIDSLQMNVFTANVINGQADYGNIVAYKIFTDYKLSTQYYRLSGANTTVLSANLSYTDTEIFVNNISALPDSGSVWINAEKIIYQDVDRINGKLLDIRRGSLRTSVPIIHALGSLVTDATPSQLVNEDFLTNIIEDVTVENGIPGSANSSTYLSSAVKSIPQGRIWLDLGT